MKRSFLWIIICVMFITILMGVGKLIFKDMELTDYLTKAFKNREIKEYSLWEEKKMKENPNYTNLAIFININSKSLEVFDQDGNQVIKRYAIASGKESTPSPIGNWRVISKGKWGKGFGTRWMGLNVPWGKYGIHGTNKPHSIGWASSHGCIRMRNNDVEELYKIVKHGTPVTIWGGTFGPFGNGFRILSPGDRGSDVYEIQKRMKLQGYYPLYVDGIYGDGMKSYVIKFRKDKGLTMTHDLDYQFYKALGIELFE
ncbi:L,D-transpeptidase family protein [Wukongibacter baidiensis]|uniref:L,D-transpeptidase family protein n=1 Tax=Wukongibacter baidiensis TaxID=1723361 RepID=UPI003D7FD778